jgi:D-aminoacyl-tRNA deacylase
MRALVQRVSQARVTVDGEVTGEIEQGLLVFLGAGPTDTEALTEKLLTKILNIRIFCDEAGKMNLDVRQVGGGILLVSQFTLYAECSRGNRPAFTGAAPAAEAKQLYEYALSWLRKQEGLANVGAGIFGVDMKVSLLNDGPVTIWLDTEELF